MTSLNNNKFIKNKESYTQKKYDSSQKNKQIHKNKEVISKLLSLH